ncbi:MAG TPA: hypothetical protein VLX92_15290 [Kofleriaceae bacterium]|nr:hypothetical protein [Kofleriaceae bacterium]
MRGHLLVVVAVAACGSSKDKGPTFASQHPHIYLATNHDRLAAALGSTDSGQRFQKMVDGWVGGQDVYGFSDWNAAMVGQLTGDPKYCAAAIKDIDSDVMAADAAIGSGNAPDVAGDDYLQVGGDIGDLALTYDWCYDAIPSDRRTAWLAYANQAVSNVWDPDHAMWGSKSVPWSGWAVDDPSDNYYYSFLRATMLLGLAEKGDDPAGDAWIAQFHDTKLTGELVPTFDMDLTGGGSREGTGYGVSMRDLFELYDLWAGSTGEVIATLTPHTRASMLAFIHQVLPTLDRVAPTGDQSRDSTASFFDYHRQYLAELVTLFPQDELSPRIQALLAGSTVPKMSQPFEYAYDFLYDNAEVAPTTLDGLGPTYYASGIGQVYARSGWDAHATWLDFTAGPYTESHAHQDQGAIMLYKDGWLAYDAVIDSHSGLRQEVEAHGTMRLVDSGTTVPQNLGDSSQLLALHAGTGYVHMAADLSPVYKQKETSLLQREVVYLPPDVVVVYDRATTPAAVQQVWQLAMPAQPTLNGSETTETASGHTLTVLRASPSGATGSIYDYTTDSDFSGGYRLDETAAGGDQRWLHVLWIDGGVTSQMTIDANTIQLGLAGGQSATVAFDPAAIGATLTLGGQTITLGAGVDQLPE